MRQLQLESVLCVLDLESARCVREVSLSSGIPSRMYKRLLVQVHVSSKDLPVILRTSNGKLGPSSQVYLALVAQKPSSLVFHPSMDLPSS